MTLKMLLAVQPEPSAPELVARARGWARRFGGVVDLCMIADPKLSSNPFAAGSAGPLQAMDQQRARVAELEKLAELLPEAHRGEIHLFPGPVVPKLLEAAKSTDLLVMGTHQRQEVPRFFLGSVSEKVVGRAPVPVLVLPLGPPASPDQSVKVLAPYDLGDRDPSAVNWVASRLPEAEVHMVYALPWGRILGEIFGGSDAYEVAVKKLHEASAQANVQDEVLVSERTHAGDAIVAHARSMGAQLIAMPTHGRGALAKAFLGSVATHVVRYSDCAVLVVPAKGA